VATRPHRVAEWGGKSRLVLGSGVPPLAKGCFSESSATESGLLEPRYLVELREFTGAGAAVEIINRFLGKILPSGDIDGPEPAFLSPAPCGACCHPDLIQPSGEADHRRASDGMCLAV